MNQPKYSFSRRLVRGLGLTRNPLCRRIDRVEGALRVALTALVMVAVAASALFGAKSFHRASVANAERRSQLREVQVELLESVPNGRGDPNAVTPARVPGVDASWTLPDGSSHTGTVYPRDLARKGDVVTVWMDRDYKPVRPPVARTDLRAQAIVSTISLAGLAALLLWLGYQFGLGRLNRRRDAAWTHGWRLVEPGWRDHQL